jgi:drug/metabolite transporter (DMT)-like permease
MDGHATLAAPAAASRSGPSPLLIYGAAVFAVTLWGGTPIATKIAVDGFDPLLVGVLRSGFAGLMLIPVVLAVRVPRPRGPRAFMLLLASALSGFAFFPIVFAIGLRHTTASHAALIMTAQPIFTGAVASLVERRWPGNRWALGCILALAGEVALIGFRLGLGGAGNVWGDLLIISGGFAASAGYVAGSKLSRSIGTWATTVWGNILGGLVMLAPLVYWGPAADWQAAHVSVWGALLYLALCSSIVGYIAWYWALAKGGVARIGAMQFAMPVLSVVLAMLVLGEAMTLPLLLAALVIFCGIWIAQRP